MNQQERSSLLKSIGKFIQSRLTPIEDRLREVEKGEPQDPLVDLIAELERRVTALEERQQ